MLDETTKTGRPEAGSAPANRLTQRRAVEAAATMPEAADQDAARAADDERGRRAQDYRLFRQNAEAVFGKPPQDAGHVRMRLRSGFHVSMTRDNERAPGAADSVVEVFYGPRALPDLERLSSDAGRRQWRAPLETGATLLYTQGADGVVTVFLYPAQTDQCLAQEDAIILGRYTDLAPLTGRGTLESHWQAFRAYAEATSLDGEPTLLDKLLVRWLRFTRPRVVDNRRTAVAAVTAAAQTALGGVALAIAAALLGAA